MVLDTVIVAAAGCAGAVLSAGSCAHGAITAAFANMYNKWGEEWQRMWTRDSIATTAKEHEGSKAWRTDAERGMLRAGEYKCNLFVYDILKSVGIDMGLPNPGGLRSWLFGRGPYPYGARAWSNKDLEIPGWGSPAGRCWRPEWACVDSDGLEKNNWYGF